VNKSQTINPSPKTPMNPLAKRLMIHTLIYLVLFLLIPYLQSGGSGVMKNFGTWLLLLVLVNPTAVLILAAEAGLRIGFRLLICLLPLPLFVLSIYVLFDGRGALFYGIMYSVVALISSCVAANVRRRKQGGTE
jgi:hypothetical protein